LAQFSLENVKFHKIGAVFLLNDYP